MNEIVEEIFYSLLMRRKISYRVILPENYRYSEKKYPVIYLLHGLFGCCDNWLELTNIKDYSAGKELIIVLPDGGDSWYTDSATIEEEKFESSFIREFIPEIDRKYRTIDKKESRAIAGLSMGGFGSLKFALKRPELFVFAGSMSGAFDAPRQTKSKPGFDWENLSPSILKAFGEENSLTRIDNDLFEIINRLDAENISLLPHVYIDCGTEDGFLEANRELAELLDKKNINFEYHEVSGGHDWSYWDSRLKNILEIADIKFRKSK